MSTELIGGLKCIAAHLGVGIGAVLAYGRLSEDPLPFRMRQGQAWARVIDLDEWRLRRDGGEGLERHEGWPQICAALSLLQPVDRGTARAWARLPHDRLPVYGMDERGKGRQPKVWIYASALRCWVARHDLPFQTHDRLRMPIETDSPSSIEEAENEGPSEDEIE